MGKYMGKTKSVHRRLIAAIAAVIALDIALCLCLIGVTYSRYVGEGSTHGTVITDVWGD